MATAQTIRFTNDCTFNNTFDFHSLRSGAVSEPAYFRLNFSENRWWSSLFSVHKELETPERIREMSDVCSSLISAFPTLSDLEDFCLLNAEDLRNGHEYNLYVTGQELNYWLRIDTEGNYPVFIHALTK